MHTPRLLSALTFLLACGLAGPALATPSKRVLITHDGVPREVVRAAVESAGGLVIRHFANVEVTAALLDASLAVPGLLIEPERTFALDPGPARAGRVDLALSDARPMSLDALDPAEAAPLGVANFLYTGASEVWPWTDAGFGAVVAVVDTGVVPTICLAHAVIGAPGYPDGFNATDDGIPATSPDNHWHGTMVANAVAAQCGFCVPEYDLFHYLLTMAGVPPLAGYCGDPSLYFVPLFGQAPNAAIYPVKVFRAGSDQGSDLEALLGLDHVLGLHRSGALSIDIVNLSFGGPALWDGHAIDRFYAAFQRAGILVVASAGNSGPRPVTVGSPGTSRSALTVAAADYAPSSRIVYEFIGLVYGPDWAPGSGDESFGMGHRMRPTDETRIINFSSRGPTRDGRSGPEIAALGTNFLGAFPDGSLGWVSGTSFSAPTVAGGAALLVAGARKLGASVSPEQVREALLAGASTESLGPVWRDVRATGAGLLDVPAALMALYHGTPSGFGAVIHAGKPKATVLGPPRAGQTASWGSDPITLAPSETFDLVLESAETTDLIVMRIFEIDTPDNTGPVAWPNTIEVQVQGGELGAIPSTFANLISRQLYGPEAILVMEDGLWTVVLPGLGAFPVAAKPMQPGLVTVTLAGDYSNEHPVSFRLEVSRSDRALPRSGTALATNVAVHQNEVLFYPFQVMDDAASLSVDLRWSRMWDRFPTSDLDLVLVAPDGELLWGGATSSGPERATLDDPMPGTWFAAVVGYSIPLPTRFWLGVTAE